jgi:osmotically-inducible protein OsmY
MFGQERPGEYVDDAMIAAKVRASIIDEQGLKQTGVETMQSVVQSSGFVDWARIRTRAGEIARSISRVKDVKNNTIVR